MLNYPALIKDHPFLLDMPEADRAKTLHISMATLHRMENPSLYQKHTPEEFLKLQKLIKRYEKIIDTAIDTPKNSDLSCSQNLDNCMNAVQSASEEGTSMAKDKRPRVPVGIDADGKYITKQVSGDTDIERALNGVQAMYNSGFLADRFPGWFSHSVASAVHPKELHPFGAVVEEYCACYYVAKNADYAYQDAQRLKRIGASIGNDKPIEEWTKIDIQTYLDNRAKAGISHKTIADEKRVIKQIFQYAADKRYIERDLIDFKSVKNLGKKKKTRKAATVKQHADILANIDSIADPILKLCVAIVAYTGMRPEELRGLQWEDIDWNERKLYIKRAITYPGPSRHYLEGPPKTEASEDWIPIIDGLWEYFEEYQGQNGWIVHDGTGQPFETYNRWNKYWNQHKQYIDLYGQRVCEFRKTVISVLLAKKADPKSVQRLARHADISVTLNTYGEYDPDVFLESCNLLAM